METQGARKLVIKLQVVYQIQHLKLKCYSLFNKKQRSTIFHTSRLKYNDKNS